IDGVTTAYVSNNLNQYTSIGTSHLTYDADGNLVSQTSGTDATTYSSNDANQLSHIATPDNSSWSYQYDAIGNRISTTQNGQQTNFLIDPFGLGNVVGRYNAGGSVIDHYVHGLGLSSLVDQTGTACYYDFDGIGSTA